MMRDDNHERSENNEHPEHNGNSGHHVTPHGGHRPTGSKEIVKDPWMPGLVEVKFKRSEDSGLSKLESDNSDEMQKPAHEWRHELLKVLLTNQMLAWKPSFPVTYPWSKQTRDQAEKFFHDSGRDQYVTFRFSENADVVQIAADLKKVPQIERAKPVARLIPSAINDPFFGTSDQVPTVAGAVETQWYAFRCKLDKTVEQFKGRRVIIAAIDWGFDTSHPDYAEGIELTKNLFYNNEFVGNGNYIHHGTAVLGLAGARDNGEGMVGFAPGSILWAIQAGEDEIMDPRLWLASIDFVRLQPASSHRKVIVIEAQTAMRGNIEAVEMIRKAIVDAVEADIVVCVPAGNAIGKDAGFDDQETPEAIPETGSILVGATWFGAQNNVVCSRHGERIAVYAPGDPSHDLTCTSLPDMYTNFFGGSSGAAAKVAGAVALMLEADDSLTPAQVKAILGQSEIDVVQITDTNEEQKVGVLLDCEYSVYVCNQQKKPEPVLTKYSAVV